jgi:hypothetical protein
MNTLSARDRTADRDGFTYRPVSSQNTHAITDSRHAASDDPIGVAASDGGD